ncbi:unnamed protein product [Polarella glacialis]|uniref:Uncharacterized protein n=1 Tax=Polarella glacialis TaxID=89957 RepID=A0A813K708_POLGL|nr:unnamed protein product [Polarella glacialis]
MGHANSVELLPNGEMAQVPADATSDSSDDDDLPPDDFDVPASSTEDPAGSSHRAQALFTPDADYLRLNARSELKDGLPTMPNTDPYLETVMRMHDRYREPRALRNIANGDLEAAGDFMQLPPVKAASLAADPVQPKDMDLTARTAWESDHEEAIWPKTLEEHRQMKHGKHIDKLRLRAKTALWESCDIRSELHSPTNELSALRGHLSNDCSSQWPPIVAQGSVRLTLEEKMCVELGVVRGCAAVVLDILPDEREPLYDQGAHLEPFLFRYVPEALIMEVPGATWLKEPELGPGRFYLGRAKRNWKYNVSITMACHFLDAATTKKPVTINRVQLPVTNMFALTVYALQGQTLPAIIVDVARPPGMSRDEHWISLLVLLSRVRQIEDVVILRLPEKKCFEGGPPEFLTSEYACLMCLEQETLLMLDKQLAAVQLHDIRAQVTQPLLNEMRNTVETRKRQDIQSSSLPKRRRAT